MIYIADITICEFAMQYFFNLWLSVLLYPIVNSLYIKPSSDLTQKIVSVEQYEGSSVIEEASGEFDLDLIAR